MEEITNTTECQELKTIKYKTMLLNGAPLKETKTTNNLSNLDKYLENEKNNNMAEPWCKLYKTIKMKKLQDFVEVYGSKNDLDEEEKNLMLAFLKDCIDRKKLQKVKDVVYDKEEGIIKDIPSLCFMKANKHFTLKNMDKRVSTLKSLAPKKTGHGTIRKKEEKTANVDSDEEDA